MFILIITARGIFFKQTDINLIVPIVNDAPNIHDKNRLIKFEVLDSSPNSTHYTFSLTQKQDYLHLNAVSGELWFHRAKWNENSQRAGKNVSKKIHIKATSTANTSVTLHFTPYSSLKDFCEQNLCFYDGITFNTFEDFRESFKVRDVGKVAPKFHQRMCKEYKADYKLLDGKL